MLPTSVAEALAVRFGPVARARPVGGGDTSAAAHARFGDDRAAFVKWGRGHAARSYVPEADGLRALRSAAPAGIVVPEVLAQADETDACPGYLALEWLVEGHASPDDWRRFGGDLARLHGRTADLDGYGWTRDNYLGRAPQANAVRSGWPAFYGEQRLGAMRAYVAGLGRWRRAWDVRFDRVVASLPERLALPAGAPEGRGLVHGDLWRGNAFALRDGRFALVDPAVYVGRGEVDLALSELFGGFPPAFYAGYDAVRPRVPGYAGRRDVYQLYHLVMHLAVSAGYGEQVGALLARMT